jgi:ATP/maltotriose-dependent transcriptional regulator MalT
LNYQSYAKKDNHEWSISQASVKLSSIYALMGEVEQSRRYIFDCLKRLRNADETNLELVSLLCEARCLIEEGKFETAVALAAFVASHPITWNETRELAKALLAEQVDHLYVQKIQTASTRFQDQDVHALTSIWLSEYESQMHAME